jgi:hypothetical protein
MLGTGHVLLESDRWHLFADGLSPISPLGDIPQPLSGTALATSLSVADLFSRWSFRADYFRADSVSIARTASFRS